jgi:hypothetical protein
MTVIDLKTAKAALLRRRLDEAKDALDRLPRAPTPERVRALTDHLRLTAELRQALHG